jgi:PAS domain S-box-containing protein
MANFNPVLSETYRESEERYRTLFNAIDEGFCIVEMIYDDVGQPVDYRFLEVNPAFERQTGLRHAEGRRMRDLAPLHEEHWFQIYSKVALTGEPIRFVNRSEVLNRWFDVYAFRVGLPGEHQVAILFNDITQQRLAEEELRQSEEHLRVAVETAQLGTWAFYPIADEGYADDRTRELYGFPENQKLTYELYLSTIHPEDRERVHERIQRVLHGENDGMYRDEFRVIGLTNHVERWIRGAGRLYFDSKGQPLHVVGTVLDITDLVKARELLTRRGAELERIVEERTAQLRDMVQQLETFSYSVVHDMRAPLRSVRSFANILGEEYGNQLDATARGYLDRLKASVERMDALITDVLTYSRVTSTEAALAPVDLDKLVHEIVEQYPQFQECASCVEIRSPLPPVRGNRALLTQCISNLLGNALKFVPPGAIPHVVVRHKSLDGHVRLCFEDNGIGIAPEFQNRIFGLFQRLHRSDQYPGTGVGLAIVQKAVERMRGTVGFESQPGKGSCFWIEVPAAR